MRSVGIFIFDFGVDSGLGLVLDPLADEELVLVVVEVGSLAFTLIFNPVSFEVIAVSLREHTIAVSLALVPLAFIDVLVRVDHTAFTLGKPVDPVTVVTITILVEERTAAMLFVFVPVAGVLATQFVIFISPVSALAVSFVNRPLAFVFIAVLVMLDSESFLAVVAPLSNVAR